MFCNNCGSQLPDGVKFCPSCGSPVANPTEPQPFAGIAAPVEVPAPAEAPAAVDAPTEVYTPAPAGVTVPIEPAAAEAPTEVYAPVSATVTPQYSYGAAPEQPADAQPVAAQYGTQPQYSAQPQYNQYGQGQTTASQLGVPQFDSSAYANQPAKAKKSKLPLIIGIVVGVVVLAVIAGAILLGGKDTPVSTGGPHVSSSGVTQTESPDNGDNGATAAGSNTATSTGSNTATATGSNTATSTGGNSAASGGNSAAPSTGGSAASSQSSTIVVTFENRNIERVGSIYINSPQDTSWGEPLAQGIDPSDTISIRVEATSDGVYDVGIIDNASWNYDFYGVTIVDGDTLILDSDGTLYANGVWYACEPYQS